MSTTNLKKTLSMLAEASSQSIKESPADNMLGRYCQIELEKLKPGVFQPRKSFTESALKELAESIAKEGILQPLIVRPLEGETYEIIAGERRWRASKLAGLKSVPVIIKAIDDECALAFGILENLQRENLNPIEEAIAFRRLINEFSLTHDDVAGRLGKSRAYITNHLRLLRLPDEIRTALENNDIQAGHGKALLSAPADKVIDIFKVLLNNSWSVRELEAYLKRADYTSQSLAPKKKSDREIELELLLGSIINEACDVSAKANSIKISMKDTNPTELIKRLKTLLREIQHSA